MDNRDEQQKRFPVIPFVQPNDERYSPVQLPAAPEAPAQPALAVAEPPRMRPSSNLGPTPVELPSTLQQKTASDQAELTRMQQTGSGLTQLGQHPGFFHKLGAVAGRIGDIAGTALFPSITAQIPGTELHHQMLMNQQANRVVSDLGQQQQEQQIEGEQQKQNIERQNNQLVTVKDSDGTEHQITRAQLPAWQTKMDATAQKRDAAQNRFMESLSKTGMKLDDDGQIAPMSEEELPVGLRGDLSLKKVREDYYSALSDLARSKNDPNSPAYRLAMQKLQVARQNAAAAAQRAAAYTLNATSGAYGTDPQGNALPGAMLTDEGQPVGAKFQQNVRPTGQQRSKANLAQSADEQLKDLKDIVTRRKDIFGPAAGRTTDFTIWAGSQDPDAQRFRAARTIAGDHLAGVFGGRSEAALQALDAAIGHYKDNPKAIISGIDQLSKANQSFVKAGTYRTAGDRQGTRQTGKAAGGTIFARDPQGNLHQAPAGTTLPQGWKLENR